MKGLEEYLLPIKGMKLGLHKFRFVLDEDFFQHFEYGDIKKSNIDVSLEIEKKETMWLMDFNISGTVNQPCDRCLEDFDLRIHIDRQFILKQGLVFDEEDTDVMIVPEETHQFDISPLLYEYCHLALPIKRMHDDDDFGNPGCISGQIKASEKNIREAETDPRWDALKKLKHDNK